MTTQRRDSTPARSGRHQSPSTTSRRASASVIAAALLVALVVGLLTARGSSPDLRPSTASASSAVGADQSAPRAAGFQAATADDAAFNRRFNHEFADVDGVRMHYVTGGSGPPLVLLHGWPQSWFEWRGIMPELAKKHRVYAVDLPGLGDSRGAPPSYDKATLARYLHSLLAGRLGLGEGRSRRTRPRRRCRLPVRRAVPRLRRPLRPLGLPAARPSAERGEVPDVQLAPGLHDQEKIPEFLVEDDVRRYLAEFYQQVAYGGVAFGGPGAKSPFTRAQIREFARTYRRPQVLTGGFELYRTLDRDEIDNEAAERVRVPTMLMAAEGGLAPMQATTKALLTNVVREVEVPRSGHWLPEENPRFVTARLLRFFDRAGAAR